MQEEPLGTLVSRLLSDGQRLARAEVNLHVATAKAKVDSAKLPAMLLVTAVVLVVSAVAAFLVAIVMALAPRIGAVWAGLVVLLVTVAIAGLLAKVAIGKLGANA